MTAALIGRAWLTSAPRMMSAERWLTLSYSKYEIFYFLGFYHFEELSASPVDVERLEVVQLLLEVLVALLEDWVVDVNQMGFIRVKMC